MEISVFKNVLHYSNLIVRHYDTTFKHDSVRHTLEAVLNQKLIEVAISIHVEVSCIHFCHNVFNFELLRGEGLGLSELEDTLFKVMVSWEYCNYYIKLTLLSLFCVSNELD